MNLLTAAPQDRKALAELRRLGFADPRAALANLHALTPEPRDAERLAPLLPRLLQALAEAPDPDMALNNLERLAAQGDRVALFRLLGSHPGALHLMAKLGGTSQFLADTLRRHPTLFPWLLEGQTMRQWHGDELAAALEQTTSAFERLDARWNALRRFKYRQLLRIGSRDLLGDADLTVTTEELSRLADVCLEATWRWAEERLRERFGVPQGPDGAPTGLAVIGMGKLGGDELNYSSDIDLVFVYGEDGETSGGTEGRIPNGDYFAAVARDIVAALESVTEEGYAFRVDLRLRPEGRMGGIILSLDGYRTYLAERAELWERQALIKARFSAGDVQVANRFFELIRPFVFRPGLDPDIVAAVRGMKRQIDRSLSGKGVERRHVKLGRGGIREVEFLVQALQLLYSGDDPWVRERNSLRAIFRLTERGYLPQSLGRFLGEALRFLRTVEHRLQIVDEFQTHTLPEEPAALARLARRLGSTALPVAARRGFEAEYRRVTRGVHGAFSDFFAAPPKARAPAPRIPTYTALKATGFADPDRARENLRLVLEGRPLVPYAEPLRRALHAIFPVLLDALWQSPDPDEALNQFERFVAAAGPRTAYLELLAEELGITWRMLLGVTDAESFSREMTALAEAALGAGWLMALGETAEVFGVPRDAAGRLIPACIIGLGKFGGRELSTGSDLDLFVVYGGAGETDGFERVEAHMFYARAVEALSSILGDVSAAGVVVPVELRLRPGSKGSVFASSVEALGQYYREWADPWERQTLTRARLVGGDGRLGRVVRREIRALVHGPDAPPPDLKEMRELRGRMEKELGRETPGRLHVKFGRGGLVDVEFIAQAIQMA